MTENKNVLNDEELDDIAGGVGAKDGGLVLYHLMNKVNEELMKWMRYNPNCSETEKELKARELLQKELSDLTAEDKALVGNYINAIDNYKLR